MQLTRIYRPEYEDEKFLSSECPAVQQQQGSIDCGVFAIAFPSHAGIIINLE